MRSSVVLACCLVATSTALAQPTAAELAAEGEKLAKSGRYTQAIDQFKAADRIEQRASHACLIALAYTRRELWSQAQIFLDLCKQRASASDPLPPWVPAAEQQLTERLAAAQVAPVEIVVEPPGADVSITVSSFAPDETFGPRTIHLPPGRHVIIARSITTSIEEPLDITDTSRRRVVLDLRAKSRPLVNRPPSPPAAREVPPPTSRRSNLTRPSFWATVAGGGLLITGAIVHATYFKEAADKLDEATDPANPDVRLYDEWEPRFDRRRALTIGLYAGAGTFLLASVILRRFESIGESTAVSLTPRRGGAIVTLEWRPF